MLENEVTFNLVEGKNQLQLTFLCELPILACLASLARLHGGCLWALSASPPSHPTPPTLSFLLPKHFDLLASGRNLALPALCSNASISPRASRVSFDPGSLFHCNGKLTHPLLPPASRCHFMLACPSPCICGPYKCCPFD